MALYGCDDQALTNKAYEIIGGLHGTAWEPGPYAQYACPAPRPNASTTYHWGVFYPPGYYHPGIADYTVCFTAGLSRDNLRHGTVALHEAGHLYFHRLRERGLWDIPLSQEERDADCFSRIFGKALMTQVVERLPILAKQHEGLDMDYMYQDLIGQRKLLNAVATESVSGNPATEDADELSFLIFCLLPDGYVDRFVTQVKKRIDTVH